MSAQARDSEHIVLALMSNACRPNSPDSGEIQNCSVPNKTASIKKCRSKNLTSNLINMHIVLIFIQFLYLNCTKFDQTTLCSINYGRSCICSQMRGQPTAMVLVFLMLLCHAFNPKQRQTMMSKNFNSVLKNMDSLNFVAAEKLHYLSNYF